MEYFLEGSALLRIFGKLTRKIWICTCYYFHLEQNRAIPSSQGNVPLRHNLNENLCLPRKK